MTENFIPRDEYRSNHKEFWDANQKLTDNLVSLKSVVELHIQDQIHHNTDVNLHHKPPCAPLNELLDPIKEVKNASIKGAVSLFIKSFIVSLALIAAVLASIAAMIQTGAITFN